MRSRVKDGIQPTGPNDMNISYAKNVVKIAGCRLVTFCCKSATFPYKCGLLQQNVVLKQQNVV